MMDKLLYRWTMLYFVLLMAPAIVHAEIVTREYKATFSQSTWTNYSSKHACHLSQKIPLYGEFIFSHRANNTMTAGIWVNNPPQHEGYARLYSMPAEWKPVTTSLDLGRILISPSQRPFSFKHQSARRLMKELEMGNSPTIFYEDWLDAMDDVKITVSPIGFRDALQKHNICISQLDPMSIEEKTKIVTVKSLTPAATNRDAMISDQRQQKNSFSDLDGETTVYFDTNIFNLTRDARRTLNTLVDYLDGNPDYQVVVVTGHTDNIGSDDDNIALGQRRADKVRDYLVSKGVKKEIIQTISEGEHSPIRANKTAEGRAINRRTHVMPRS
ncbi:MAG: OmpA family protein [Gammaproteobacteria bacterium]|nr:MAG: OmpA family protein [Gammaproteobacteria bacterium]